MRVTSKGQVTIPADICEKAGLLPDTEVEVTYDGGGVRIVRAQPGADSGRGARTVARLRGTADLGLSTDEIMAMTRDG